jgi:hypothetical protein
VESVLVAHVKAVAPKPGKNSEYSTKNRDGRRPGSRLSMSTHRRLNLRKTFANGTASRDVDQQWAHQIAYRLAAARPATGYRHGNRYWID